MRAELGVEIRRRLLGADHPYRARQVAVERAGHRLGGELSHDGERRHLAERVDACVGASRPGYGDVAAVEHTQRILDVRLDGHAVLLPLPADVTGAIVGQRDLEVWHHGVLNTTD